jgi:hypothetical protein
MLLLLESVCNNLVKSVNGGFMPVATSYGVIPAGYIPVTSDTHFKFLADIIRVNYTFFSVGDLLGYAGFLLACVGLVWWGVIVCQSLIIMIYKQDSDYAKN